MTHYMKDAESIFLAALEKETLEARTAYLTETCGTDSALRKEVDALLDAHENAGSFLAKPPSDLSSAGGTVATDDLRVDQAGTADISLDFLEPSDNPERLGTLGAYEIMDIVGRGGMGIVLKGFDPKLNRVVATKVLAPELAANATARRRFLREAQSAAAISHDHVVTIYAIHDDGELPFIVMEYISGQSLQQRIDRSGPLESKEILRIGKQIAAGLAAAHAEGLIHRDIKPANILLENGIEKVKVTDFGLARATDDFQITRTGVVAGSPQYMSPEQANGETLDCRADLFSLGGVLYTMGTGHSPFRAENVVAAIRRVCDDVPPPLTETNPDLPDFLAMVVARLLAKDPGDRFQSAVEVCELLERYLAHLQQPSTIPKPSLSSDRVSLPKKPHAFRPAVRIVQTTAAIVLVALLAVGVSDATGVTNVGEYVTTIFISNADYGTLAVKIMDPNVGMTIEGNGEEIVLTGIGIHEIRLRPGRHAYRTVKDGRVIKEAWVTVMRGKKRLVRIGPPQPAAETHADTQGELTVDIGGPHIEKNLISFTLSGNKARRMFSKWGEHSTSLPAGEYQAQIFTKKGTLARRGTMNLQPGCDRRVNWRAFTALNLPLFPSDRALRRELLKHSGGTTSVIFSPCNSKVLATTSIGDFGVYLWNWNGEEWQERTISAQHKGAVRDLAFSPDGSKLAIAGGDESVTVWNVATGAELNSLQHGGLESVAFMRDSLHLCSASDQDIVLWNVDSMKAMASQLMDRRIISRCIAAAPDKQIVAVGHPNGGITIWDIPAGKKQLLVGHTSAVTDLTFSANGEMLASASGDATAIIWDVQNLRRLHTLGEHRWTVTSVAFSPDNRVLVTGCADHALRLWDVTNGSLLEEGHAHWGKVSDVTISPDGNTVATASNNGVVRIWDFSQIPEAPNRPHLPLRAQFYSLAQRFSAGFSRDGKRLFIPFGDLREVEVWNLGDLRQMESFPASGRMVRCAVARDADRLVAATKSGTVQIWDGEELSPLPPIELGQLRTSRVAISSHGRFVAAAHAVPQDRQPARGLTLWDAETGKTTILHDQKVFWSVAFLQQSHMLAAGTNGRVLVWKDIANNDAPMELIDPDFAVNAVAFSPDGRLLAASGKEIAKIWDMATRKQVGTLKGHEGFTLDVAFSNDGKILVAGGGERGDADELRYGSLTAWNVSDRKLLATEKSLIGPFYQVSFSPDGKTLLTVHGLRHVRLWNLPESGANE